MASVFELWAPVPRRLRMAHDPAAAAAEEFAQILRDRPPFECAMTDEASGRAGRVWPLPGLAAVDFWVEGETLAVYADPRPGGAGLAAALGHRLRALGDHFRLIWRSSDRDGSDAEAMARRRNHVGAMGVLWAAGRAAPPVVDVDQASAAAAAALRSACARASRDGAAPCCGLPDDFEFGPEGLEPGSVATPLGPMPPHAAAALAGADGPRLFDLAEPWTPWPHPGLNADVWSRLARAALWTAFTWSAPMPPLARAAEAFAEHAEAEARRFGGSALDADEVDIAGVRAAIEGAAEARPVTPAPVGPGYLRRWRRRRICDGASVEAPGWWIETRRDDAPQKIARDWTHYGLAVEIRALAAPADAPVDDAETVLESSFGPPLLADAPADWPRRSICRVIRSRDDRSTGRRAQIVRIAAAQDPKSGVAPQIDRMLASIDAD